MKSEKILNFRAGTLILSGLSLLLSLSLTLSLKQDAAAAEKVSAGKSSPAKPKSDKPAAEKTEADKKDKEDKKDDKAAKEAPKPEPVIENVVNVQSMDLVDKPHEYIGKNVKFTAPFFAFSNLALDYKPAFRSSKTHISILVSQPKKKIPLSELKLAMMTPKEKDPETTLLSNLKEGDTVEITGKVFSAALDDPWVEILKLKKIGGSQDDKKADAASKTMLNVEMRSDSKNEKNSGNKGEGDKKTAPKN